MGCGVKEQHSASSNSGISQSRIQDSEDVLKRNVVRPRLALALALRRLFWFGVSNARKRRTSSRIPSASSLLLSRFNARSTGSPLRTITSGIDNHSCPQFRKLGLFVGAEPTRAKQLRQLCE